MIVTTTLSQRMIIVLNTPNTFANGNGPSRIVVPTPRQAALIAGKYHLLAGAVFGAGVIISNLPIVRDGFTRLAWWLAPWRSFPSPYDIGERHFWPADSMKLVLGMVLAWSSLSFLTHGAVFRATALLYRSFGRPRYWPDISKSFSMRAAWAESARRSWWIWPTVLMIWISWSSLAWGLRQAFYPFINDGLPFLIANLVTLLLAYAHVSAQVVREHVVATIRPQDLRCVKCDYRLRGLQTCRCPECDHQFDPLARPEFRFKWERFEGRGRCRRFVRVLLLIALLAAPLWVPLAILGAPRTWLRRVPAFLLPDLRVIHRDRNAFPIRPDAVCRIRHGEALYILRFRYRRLPYGPTYVAGYWPNAESFGRRPPESTVTGEVGCRADPLPWEGPWNFRWQLSGTNIVWLYRPDATYEVEAMLVENFDGDLTWAEQDPEGQP